MAVTPPTVKLETTDEEGSPAETLESNNCSSTTSLEVRRKSSLAHSLSTVFNYARRRNHNHQNFDQRRSSPSPARVASLTKNFKVARVSSRNLHIGTLSRSKLYNSFPNLSRKDNAGHNYSIDDENVQRVLKAVQNDHVVATNNAENKNRRTIFIEKPQNGERFGFTIQSYTFRHAKTSKIEQITYVDYVDLDSHAFVAGLRAGDIILSINGRNVQNETHHQLVGYISQCSCLRMVVLFENCVNKIDLCAKAIKLKKLLADKEFELRLLSYQENRVMSGLPSLPKDCALALLRAPCCSPRAVTMSLPDECSILNGAYSSNWSSIGGTNDDALSERHWSTAEKISSINEDLKDTTFFSVSGDQKDETFYSTVSDNSNGVASFIVGDSCSTDRSSLSRSTPDISVMMGVENSALIHVLHVDDSATSTYDDVDTVTRL